MKTQANTTVTNITIPGNPGINIEVFIMTVGANMLSAITTTPAWGSEGDPEVCGGCCKLNSYCRC